MIGWLIFYLLLSFFFNLYIWIIIDIYNPKELQQFITSKQKREVEIRLISQTPGRFPSSY